MRAVGRLTKDRIKALAAKPAQYVLWDRTLPGFGVRVSPGGTKTYIVKYRLTSGRVRWKTIARVDVLPIDEARKRARRDLGVVADDADPLSARDRARASVTLGDVATQFLEDHVAARRKVATLRLYRLAIENYIRPRVGSVPVAEVTSADVAKLHHQMRRTPYLANRAIAVLSKLCAWCEVKRYRPTGSNPCRGLEKYSEDPRRRYLTPNELKRVGAALRIGARYRRLSPAAIASIRLLVLTGARVSEILSLKWSHVDLAAGVLRLPDSKTGAKEILLNAAALDVLKRWPRWARSPYVFPGEGRGDRKGAHRVNLTDAWAWMRRRAKVPDVRLHDLRHSFASVAVSSGQTLPIVGALLGHTQAQTTQRYAHLLDDPLRAASEATAASIVAAIDRRAK